MGVSVCFVDIELNAEMYKVVGNTTFVSKIHFHFTEIHTNHTLIEPARLLYDYDMSYRDKHQQIFRTSESNAYLYIN